jgi:parallel beta-helix repeat protein
MTVDLLKKGGILTLLAILLLSIMVGVQTFTLVCADPIPGPPINVAYILSNGTVDPSTLPIVRDGNFYTLTGDIFNYSMIVQCDNIVINGAGYGIHGYSTYYYDGIDISYRTNITIKNMDISPFGFGVRMDYGSNNTVIGNRMSAFTGVSLLYSDNNQIIGNVITDGYGVQGLGSYNLISGNNFTSGLSGGGNGMGIYLTGNNNTISQNFFQEELSIQITSSNYNTISNNTIVDGRTGILLGRSSNNLVFGNTIKGKIDTTSGALWISSDSTNNRIYANQFENNALAISLGTQIANFIYNNVSNNYIYRNNFINNTQNVWIAPGAPVNFWDNGQQGNYWSNFHGIDSNGDGLSETPYVITANNTDHYPFMQPIDFSTSTPPSATPSPSPSPTMSPTGSTSSPKPTQTPTVTPQMPELTIWAIILLFTVIPLIVIHLRIKNAKSK